MPSDATRTLAPVEGDAPIRSERPLLVGFARDLATLEALRTGLGELAPAAMLDLRRGSAREAIAALGKLSTPQTLLVDIADEAQPLGVLDELSQVVEPDVRVLAVGDRTDADFYRRLTRGMGVLEYLYKPLTAELVAQHFGPIVVRRPRIDLTLRGGRVLAVSGVRGGVGATTIAVNLAWLLAQVDRRYTALLDGDLHTGTASMMLNVEPGPGLRAALERPERVDELFVERAARPVGERLHVLASEADLTDPLEISLAGPERLVSTMRRRYNFVVIDVPQNTRTGPLRTLAGLCDQRVLVMEPSLASLRDTLRLLNQPAGPFQIRRPFLVLNRAGRKGGLTLKQVEEGLLQKPDLVIPDLSGRLGEAATLGEPAAARPGVFRTAMITLARELTTVGPAPPPKRRWTLFGKPA